MAPRAIRRSGALAGAAICATVLATGFGVRAFLLPQGSGRRAALASAGAAVLGASASVRAEDTPAAAASFTKTPSGVQYAIVTEGSGIPAENGDLIRVDYNGYLGGFNVGKPFDTTGYTIDTDGGTKKWEVSKPEKNIVGSSANLKGWNEALVGMKVGEKKKVIIPAELAFGERGGGVPPKSTLYYEITLVWNARAQLEGSGKAFVKASPVSPF